MSRIFIPLFYLFVTVRAFSQDPVAEMEVYKTVNTVKNNRLTRSVYCEIQVNSREGEKYTTVQIPYSKLIKVSKIDAFVKNNLGQVVKKLQKSDINVKSAFDESTFYGDSYVKEFTMKHNIYPYRICYSYDVEEDQFLFIDDWDPVLNTDIPTLNATLEVNVPVNYPVKYTSRLTDNLKIDTLESGIRYTWTASYKKILKPEIFSPSLGTLIPEVMIVPLNFTYDLPGSSENWTRFGDWHSDLLRGLSDLSQGQVEEIRESVAGITDKKEQIRKLYHRLQDETRYINITIETGGLKPYPASYVAQNKYGDCKALSNYFKAVLDAAGIKSYYTKILAGDQIIDINKGFPSQQFNHIILTIPLEKDTLWLDCTSDGPFNYLGTFTQNRDALIIEQGNSRFVKTPALKPAEVLETRNAVFRFDREKGAVAQFSKSFKGDAYETMLYLSHSVSDSDKPRILRNNYVETGFELIDFNFEEPVRDLPRIFLNYSAKSDKIYKVYGNDLIIDVLPFSIPHFSIPSDRKLPVQIDYPVYKTDSLIYEIPDGYNINSKPFKWSVNSEFGNYESESFIDEKKVLVVKSFLLFPGKYPENRYSEFYKFLVKIFDCERNSRIISNKN